MTFNISVVFSQCAVHLSWACLMQLFVCSYCSVTFSASLFFSETHSLATLVLEPLAGQHKSQSLFSDETIKSEVLNKFGQSFCGSLQHCSHISNNRYQYKKMAPPERLKTRAIKIKYFYCNAHAFRNLQNSNVYQNHRLFCA